MSPRQTMEFVALAILLAASGCNVTKDYSTPTVELPKAFVAADAGSAESPAQEWWSYLEDEQLTSLIGRARDANLDLRIAVARVREARALYDRTRGGAGPKLDARAGATWLESSANLGAPFADPNPSGHFQAGFDASWEIDVFGRNARAIEAAQAGADAALEHSRDVEITLFAEVARNYVELRAAQKAFELTRANLATQQDTLDLVRVRARAEMASDFDVARAAGLAATTQALLPQLEVRMSEARHRIAVLLGLEPNALAAELSATAPIPKAPPVTSRGIPADLLRRRADVRRAERELAQATASSAQATAVLFPRISLGAAFGLEANALKRLFDKGSETFAVGPSLTAPIFHSGALRANVRAGEARREQALANYQQSALVALREVEDALVATDRERARLASLREAFSANQRALELARDLNREGLADFFDVLDAERTALAAESALAESEGRLCANTIAVYKALGGGWRE